MTKAERAKEKAESRARYLRRQEIQDKINLLLKEKKRVNEDIDAQIDKLREEMNTLMPTHVLNLNNPYDRYLVNGWRQP